MPSSYTDKPTVVFDFVCGHPWHTGPPPGWRMVLRDWEFDAEDLRHVSPAAPIFRPKLAGFEPPPIDCIVIFPSPQLCPSAPDSWPDRYLGFEQYVREGAECSSV